MRPFFLLLPLVVGLFIGQSPASPSVKPLKRGVVAYYAERCARCHGPEGSFYENGFAAKYDDKGMKAVLKRMADGPGGESLDDAGLAALGAYHRAMAGDYAFLDLTGSGAILSGETTAEKVTIKHLGKIIVSQLADGKWKAKLPNRARISDVQVSAGGVVLNLRDRAWSGPPVKSK